MSAHRYKFYTEETKPGPAIDSVSRPCPLHCYASQLSGNYWSQLTPLGFRWLCDSYPSHFLLDLFPKYPEFHSQQPRNPICSEHTIKNKSKPEEVMTQQGPRESLSAASSKAA